MVSFNLIALIAPVEVLFLSLFPLYLPQSRSAQMVSGALNLSMMYAPMEQNTGKMTSAVVECTCLKELVNNMISYVDERLHMFCKIKITSC
jgi:hypothetical protein